MCNWETSQATQTTQAIHPPSAKCCIQIQIYWYIISTKFVKSFVLFVWFCFVLFWLLLLLLSFAERHANGRERQQILIMSNYNPNCGYFEDCSYYTNNVYQPDYCMQPDYEYNKHVYEWVPQTQQPQSIDHRQTKLAQRHLPFTVYRLPFTI